MLSCGQGVYLVPGPASSAAPALGDRVKISDASDVTQYSANGRYLAVVLPESVSIFDPARCGARCCYAYSACHCISVCQWDTRRDSGPGGRVRHPVLVTGHDGRHLSPPQGR